MLLWSHRWQQLTDRPIQKRNFSPLKLIEPRVSMAKGQNMGLHDSRVFYVLSWSSSVSDTASCHARRGKVSSCERICHCHVPCEALASLPRDKAHTVGHFLLERERPAGSLTDGMLTRIRARQIWSLSWWWRIDLPAVHLQDRPCEPLASTNVPQGHIWGSHRLTPRHSLTATRTASLFSLVPYEAMARACSQSPLCGEEVVSSLLWLSVRLDHKEALSAAMMEASQACCLMTLVLSGNGMLWDAVHSWWPIRREDLVRDDSWVGAEIGGRAC